jgi:hypothetical protein
MASSRPSSSGSSPQWEVPVRDTSLADNYATPHFRLRTRTERPSGSRVEGESKLVRLAERYHRNPDRPMLILTLQVERQRSKEADVDNHRSADFDVDQFAPVRAQPWASSGFSSSRRPPARPASLDLSASRHPTVRETSRDSSDVALSLSPELPLCFCQPQLNLAFCFYYSWPARLHHVRIMPAHWLTDTANSCLLCLVLPSRHRLLACSGPGFSGLQCRYRRFRRSGTQFIEVLGHIHARAGRADESIQILVGRGRRTQCLHLPLVVRSRPGLRVHALVFTSMESGYVRQTSSYSL